MTSTNSFEIAVSDVGDCPTVVVKGEVDLGTAPLLEAEVTKLAAAGRSRVRVDLRDVSFLDSQGIKVLAAAHKQLAAGGGTLTLVEPSQPVRRVLEVTGVDRILLMGEDD